MNKLFEELKRRKVVRVAAVYAVVAWLLIQVADTVLPTFGAPTWVNQTLIFLFIIGFPIAIILAWAYEITPEGIRADAVVQQPPSVNQGSDRKLNYAIFVLVLLAVGFQVTDRFLAPVQPSTGDMREAAGPSSLETRVELMTPATVSPNDFALSPDGRQIVFAASDDNGVSQLWLRSLATSTAEPLAETEGAEQPFWSPNGRAIGFFAGGSLKRLDLSGGTPQTLATVGLLPSGTWGADNTLLFASVTDTSVLRVPASGGEATAVTTLEPGQLSHRAPHLLPDGQRFLFTVQLAQETFGIYLGYLNGTAPVRLTAAEGRAVFHPDGWLLWVRASTLTAQRLDLAQSTLVGEPLTVAGGGVSTASVASTGLIAYRTGGSQQRQLTWFDRTGAALDKLSHPDGNPTNPRLSPDGQRVALAINVQGNLDIWLLDDARSSRLTFDAAGDSNPFWSLDGNQIVFSSSRTGTLDLYQKPTNGAAEETLLLGSDQAKFPNSWSVDGRFLLYHSISPVTNRDLWALPVTGDREPFTLLQTPFNERYGTLSPDGRWMAYQSDVSGRDEIYVRAFVAPVDNDTSSTPILNGLWQISTAGGIYPTWSSAGQELYYIDPAGTMMATPLTIAGDALEVGTPIALFPTRIFGGGSESSQGRQYDVTADGRFLINSVVDDGTTTPIRLIQNWNPEAVQ